MSNRVQKITFPIVSNGKELSDEFLKLKGEIIFEEKYGYVSQVINSLADFLENGQCYRFNEMAISLDDHKQIVFLTEIDGDWNSVGLKFSEFIEENMVMITLCFMSESRDFIESVIKTISSIYYTLPLKIVMQVNYAHDFDICDVIDFVGQTGVAWSDMTNEVSNIKDPYKHEGLNKSKLIVFLGSKYSVPQKIH